MSDIQAAAEWAVEKRRMAGGLRSAPAYRAMVLKDLRGHPERIAALLEERDEARRPKHSPRLSLPPCEVTIDGPQNPAPDGSWPEPRQYLTIWDWMEKRRPELLEALDSLARREGWAPINEMDAGIKADIKRAPIFVNLERLDRDAWNLMPIVQEYRRRFIFEAAALVS
tara:strand:+ start:65 stop:571 length:507 start_codon:yes stop_codon:yes gene_type:complete